MGLTKKERVIINLVEELMQLELEDYERIKPILIAKSIGNDNLLTFMKKCFSLVDSKRPKLLEMH